MDHVLKSVLLIYQAKVIKVLNVYDTLTIRIYRSLEVDDVL